VTCLCLTRNRRQWLPKAIAAFQAQTHSPRELLVVADGEDVRDLIPSDPTIRLIHLESSIEIGGKRNFGCEHAAGTIIAHWDDDDHSAPARLADQVGRLESSGRQVTGYHSMRFTDGAKWWQYSGTLDYSVGTSLCYYRAWWRRHPFPPLQVCEDNEFVRDAVAARQLATADAGDLMYATIHEGNTSPRNMADNWKLL
jgi:glycosyltransferase involved in cell wall biosynthesis